MSDIALASWAAAVDAIGRRLDFSPQLLLLSGVTACRDVGAPVYVDREMRETIVLNIMSNAFKFTFEGEIAVSLSPKGHHIDIGARGAGSGIPKGGIPRLCERFHRVSDARGRPHKGSGIGLALTVQQRLSSA